MTIRVAIVDDVLARLLAAERDIEVVRCANGEDVDDVVRREHPDVAVIDAGTEVLRAIADTTHVVLLTSRMSDAEVVAALRLGAAGIMLKDSARRMLPQCLRTVANGEPWLDADAMHAPRSPNGDGQVGRVLTRRELDIVRMVAVGARNKKIAEQLGIAEGTVKMHLHTIYEKLEISGRVELSIYAREHAIV